MVWLSDVEDEWSVEVVVVEWVEVLSCDVVELELDPSGSLTASRTLPWLNKEVGGGLK